MSKYISLNYNELNDFYTVKQAAKLLHTTKPKIRRICNQYGIWFQANEDNVVGLSKLNLKRVDQQIHHIIQ